MSGRGGPNLAKLHTDCKHKHNVTQIEQAGGQEVVERCLRCGATRTCLKKVKWSWWQMPPAWLAGKSKRRKAVRR